MAKFEFKNIIQNLKFNIMKSKNDIKILSPAKFIKKTEIKPQPIQTTQEIDLPIECSLTKSFSNINYSQPKSRLGSDKWFLVGGSSIGKSHISIGKPCQDNHYCKNIDKNWGISVICDGAGSAENSHLGSQFVSEKTIDVFKDYLVSNKFVSKNKLPNDVEWQNISNLAFRNIYNSLCDFAEKNKIGFSSVACTVIVVVFTPIGLLSSHIGDGRAGYCNVNGEWKSLITPHKGEEANQTIFITSSAWISEKNFKMSDVLVPECRVITEKVTAFTLMTDGCETHSFDCSKMDQETNKWIDPNIPAEKFFNPLLNQLKSMYNNKVSSDEVTSRWLNFIDEGTNGLKNESDDKTLILGVNV